jgi:RNA:NAD 2'-phosphotransferase (TPT1/KptA family)
MSLIRRLRKSRRRAVSGSAIRTTEKLPSPALLETASEKMSDGIIKMQSQDIHISSDLTEMREEGSWMRPGSVALTIFFFSLAFIACIVLLISRQ